MTQIRIDTCDHPKVLRAVRNLLDELLGGEERLTITGSGGYDGEATSTTACDDQLKPEADKKGSIFDQAAGTRVDQNGVMFNSALCANAAVPFYGTGNQKGQWKRRKGVTAAAYDAWYLPALASLPGALDKPEGAAAVNTAGAFGGAATQAPAEAEPAPAEAEPAPEDCGAFMGWVSAKQAAGLLTQEDIGRAYNVAGIEVTDLFPPNDEATVKGNVTSLFNILAPIAASGRA